MAEAKYYKCMLCGQVVQANPDGTCPICGAGPEYMVPCDENGNPLE